jgi:ATP-binding cassette subfamily F protein 3
LTERETATDPMRIAEIEVRLVDIDAYSAPAKAASILAGLGFDEAAQAALLVFSGGWRMRVALAAVLFAEPDLLLLDEPTNYLDLEGTLWLEDYLARYPHTVIMISHDRDLLDTSVDADPSSRPEEADASIAAAMTSFDRQRREKLVLDDEGAQEAGRGARKHLQAFVDRFKAKASKARQAQSRVKALEKMEPLAANIE